jgi:hypothetical protein
VDKLLLLTVFAFAQVGPEAKLLLILPTTILFLIVLAPAATSSIIPFLLFQTVLMKLLGASPRGIS